MRCAERSRFRQNRSRGLERRPAEVALADHRDGKRPRDTECRVVIAVTGRRVWRIKFRDLIDNLGVVGEGLKAVSETLRDIERHTVLSCQLEPLPTKVTW